ncbi:MAG: ABC transporter ATP-binding protein [Desulfobacterales bacterium]|nr:ABC transporter ATP-binding protein [Desulfobacterales bacterium]
MEICLADVSKSYGSGTRKQVIFKHLSATFAQGEITGILGKSGMGKSTLLNLMAGIDTPDSGTLTVGGECLADLSQEACCAFRRKHIGFVFQFFHLIPALSVEENVMLVPELSGGSADLARKKAHATLADVGLEEKAKVFPETLSGGERQRVAIARALAADPDLIFADEPTGNLDGETGRSIIDLFTSLVRERGKTVVVVTHSRETASICDALYVVKEKRLYRHGG